MFSGNVKKNYKALTIPITFKCARVSYRKTLTFHNFLLCLKYYPTLLPHIRVHSNKNSTQHTHPTSITNVYEHYDMRTFYTGCNYNYPNKAHINLPVIAQ